MDRRTGIGRVVLVAILIVVLVISGIGFIALSSHTPSDSVKMTMEFSPQSYDSAYYYGISQGIYRKNGFNLTLIPGRNSAASITAVSSGEAEFGLTDTTALILGISNSNITNIRIIAITFERNYYAVIYNKASIHTIADLAGKKGGATPPSSGGAETKLFDLMAEENGINTGSINFQYSTASTYLPLIATGALQFILATGHLLPVLQAGASQNGIKLGAFYFPDYGVDTYGEALITTTQMIQQHSGEVKKFVLATMQSIEAAESDPSAAVSALTDAQPQLNYTQMLQGYQIDLSCCAKNVTGITNPLEIGWIDPLRMQQTVSTVVTGLGITTQVNASALYTDEFVLQP